MVGQKTGICATANLEPDLGNYHRHSPEIEPKSCHVKSASSRHPFPYTLWLFNTSPWKIPHKWRFLAGKIIYFYGPSIPWLCNSHNQSVLSITSRLGFAAEKRPPNLESYNDWMFLASIPPVSGAFLHPRNR